MLMPTRKFEMKRKILLIIAAALYNLSLVLSALQLMMLWFVQHLLYTGGSHFTQVRAMDRYQGKEINGRRIKLIDDSEGGRPARRFHFAYLVSRTINVHVTV